MSASKDKERGTWIVYIRYKDWKGENQVHKKRGFPTKREALEYEREFLMKKSKDLNMSFADFVDVYMEDKKPRLNTIHIGRRNTSSGTRYCHISRISAFVISV